MEKDVKNAKGQSTFKLVKAKDIHPSSILPPRHHDPRLSESTKTVGIQQPLIVRPLASNPAEDELIDGDGRRKSLDPEDQVLVEVREATDSEVFRISEATSIRNEKTTCERANFYAAYVETVKREKGEKKAASIVAKDAQISESELSQLLTINKLFVSLKQQQPETKFEKLESAGINRLYALADLLDKPELVEAANLVEKEADTITEEGVKSIVNRLLKKNEEQSVGVEDDKTTEEGAFDAAGKEDVLAVRLKDVSGKVLEKREEITTALQEVELEKLPTNEQVVSTLEKMLVTIRRLRFYCEKLRSATVDMSSTM